MYELPTWSILPACSGDFTRYGLLVRKLTMILRSVITCPHCATAKPETMPTDACRFFYMCTGCDKKLKPKNGDCCVFCSYGSVPCPPIQAERRGETGRPHSVQGNRHEHSRKIDCRLGQQCRHKRSRVVGSKGYHRCCFVRPRKSVPRSGSPHSSGMGTACILNSRRCGRTHCRYTGPYYLAMIAPVILLASGLITVDFYVWLALAALIVLGGWIIWWATERAWGKLS